jgi:hypothetical protein
VGRPSLYNDKTASHYCRLVIELGRKGFSKTQMASEIGVCRDTIEEWISVHPEFSDAISEAMTYSESWWENTGMAGLQHGVMNAAVWSRSMAARFPKTYREEHAITGPGGAPLTTVNISTADPIEAARIYQAIISGDS